MAKKSKSKTGDDEEGSSSFNPYTHLDDTLDSIEKDFSLSGSGLSRDERRMNTVSLAIDLVLGGGITAGGWYTFVGGEQSSKSTLANSTMAMAVNSSIPIVSMWDYEGSTDAEYLANILKSNRIDANVEDVFGIRDPKTGKWLVKPRVRYYSETVAEKFFDYLAKLERMLPDVRKIGDDWFYIYENTKPNKSIVGSKYDKSYFSKTGKFRVPAPNGNLQALVICDSYPAMLPEKMDTDDPSNAMAMQARMFSEQMKRVKGRMKAKRIAVIGINQLRQKPAVMFGSPEYEPGGEALKFYCFAEDTTLVTSQGLLTAKEYLEEGNGTILGVSGEEKPAMYDTMGFSQLMELKTQFGNVIKGKPGHRVFTVKHSGFGTHWRKLSSFTGSTDYYVAMKVGADLWAQESPNFDFTSINRFDNSTVEVTLPENGSVELAYVLGYLTSEGCLSENGRVIFTMADVEVMEHYYECFSDVFGVSAEVLRSKTRNVKGTLTCDFFSTEVYNFLRYLGCGTHSRDKKVPKCIRTGTREEVQAFLSAFYEGDGSVNSKSVSCFSTSYELASGIQQLLFNFGVISSLIERQGKYHSQKNLNRIWHVITNGKNSANLLKVIAFISERKAQSQSNFVGGNHKHDVLSGDLLPPVSTGSAKLDAKIKEIVFPKSKYLRASLVTASKIDVLRSWVSTLRTSHERTKNENLLNKFVSFVKNTETNGIVWAKVAKVSSAVEAGMTYDANMPDTHTIVTNGIVSHNSDCRIRLASRALSAVVNGGKGYEETEDSYNGEGEDTYRYVHARAIKNKLSVPNLECFLRIWITDSNGAAMGIDPVFDTFQYLEMTGQISGPRKKMALKLRKHDEVTLDWGQLKTLVLGSRKEVAKVCDKIGLEKMFIREFCRKQLNKGIGIDLFFENKKNAKLASKAKNKAAESEDDDDDEEED